ncbi:hypothetical protein FACS1894188_08160 [Clostridia bacterium]|nr:hypothetical protein FACS1894188_08160 [Clostridia bacterium]
MDDEFGGGGFNDNSADVPADIPDVPDDTQPFAESPPLDFEEDLPDEGNPLSELGTPEVPMEFDEDSDSGESHHFMSLGEVQQYQEDNADIFSHQDEDFELQDGLDRDDFVSANVEANPEDIAGNQELFDSNHPNHEIEDLETSPEEEKLQNEIHDDWKSRLDSENADRDDIGMPRTGWKEYKDEIKDNPAYFNEDGEFQWPDEEKHPHGFENSEDSEEFTPIEEGDEIERWGFDTGNFTTPKGSNFDDLGLPYKEEFMPHNTFTVNETIADSHRGRVADLHEGDGSGGGDQIFTEHDTVGELERDGRISLNNTH